MSRYMSFENESFDNRELLVEALKEMGFTELVTGTDVLLEGWDKRDQRVADIIIRRRAVTDLHLYGDIGFQKTSKGYVAVVDDLDLEYHLGSDFVRRLQTQYHEATARRMAKKLNGVLVKETVGKTIRIRIKY